MLGLILCLFHFSNCLYKVCCMVDQQVFNGLILFHPILGCSRCQLHLLGGGLQTTSSASVSVTLPLFLKRKKCIMKWNGGKFWKIWAENVTLFLKTKPFNWERLRLDGPGRNPSTPWAVSKLNYFSFKSLTRKKMACQSSGCNYYKLVWKDHVGQRWSEKILRKKELVSK